jgi:capsular polysaccharide transport system permease protein
MDGLAIAVKTSSHRHSSVGMRAPLRRRLRNFAPFGLVVVLPVIIAATYLFGFAADQYVSEARFVVRGPNQQAPNPLSSLLQTAGASRADDDTFAVQDFITSRDALRELMQQTDMKAIFTRPEADLLSRFSTFSGKGPFEHLYKFYARHVTVEMDTGTGVSKLTVKSFRAGDSLLIATDLLKAAEQLVNRMNARAREDAVHNAVREVQSAEQRVQDLSQRIADFRNKQGLLDPTRQSTTMLTAIAALQAKLVGVKIELSGMQPNSPMLASTRQRAAALQAQIDQANAQVTGTDRSLVPKIREFDMLSLDREFAERQLASATSALEAARINADRQQLYLEQIVQPNQPDDAEYPHRFNALLVIFFSLCGLYVTGALLVAGAKEHKLV